MEGFQISLFDFEKKKLKVLVACEESQRVCIAFREKGHNAFSCDIQPPSGGRPEWHIMGDCLPLLNGNCEFETMGKGKKKKKKRQMGFNNSTSAVHVFEQCGRETFISWG